MINKQMSFLQQLMPRALATRMAARRERKANQRKPETFIEHVWSWIKTIVWALTVVTIINGLALASFVVPTGSMESTVLAGEFLFVNKAIYGPSTPQIIPFINLALPFYKLPPIIKPEQGDVIVFIFPGNRDQAEPDNFEYYLKRCVAVAGDVLEIKGGRVFVNNKEFPLPKTGQFYQLTPEERAAQYESERYRTFPPGKGWTRDNYGPLRIPGEGDNILLSRDNIHEWATFIRREGHSVNEDRLLIDGKPVSSYTVARDYVFGMGDNRDNSLDSRFWGFIPEEDVVGTPIMVYWSMPVTSNREYVRLSDGSYEPKPLTLFERIKAVRWSRIGTFIH
ncbi:MAG: signal peptidase I [Ignavibacteria bacterium]|nr:signal peptidase I [Ignavibacteria bacterium]